MNTLIKLLNYGQSYWLDNLTRKKITSGELEKRVKTEGLRGVTSNPDIFNKAISGSDDYDDQIASLAREGKNPQEIYDALTIRDIREACDILKPVYDQSGGADGFISLEVSPLLARDTEGTIKEARRLFSAVGKPNCLIKIPGTAEGVLAIEQVLFEGININITLLFSVERYAEVAHAYIRALERRLEAGKSIDIISVASVFISRIDVLTDELIGQRITSFEANENTPQTELMLGNAGIATAKLCYRKFKEIFSGKRWEELQAKGAHLQRPLWASTSNKNPLYNDLRYVEELIGENTINTLPDATISAFAAHGQLRKNPLEENTEQALQLFADLKKMGIDMAFVTQQLENEGIGKFAEAYNTLITAVAVKREKILGDKISHQHIFCGQLEKEIKTAYAAIDNAQVIKLLFEKDPFLWRKDPKQVREINKRLGWLSLPDHYAANADQLIAFAQQIKEEGYTHAVLLGMGGSSLCSEVARQTYGTSGDYLQLSVLDNTEPAAILELESRIKLEKTLFIVASKSGGTEETLSFFRYFYGELEKKKNKNPGNNFIAITDAGTPLVKIAEAYKFRKVIVNPSDLGGRYSVLSDFGLVPMALMGLDIRAFLSDAGQMESSCKNIPAEKNPGISLGVVLGVCQKHGRDKVTFVLSSSISSFGYWVEQLLAESTGKEGRGLIPVNGELPGDPEAYGSDRVFIHMYLSSDNNEKDEKKIQALEEAGHPVVRIKVADKIALGGEYYRWEVAAAIAGLVIGINPFDQPNVEESKKNTSNILKDWIQEGDFRKTESILSDENIRIYSGKKVSGAEALHNETPGDFVARFTEQANQGDYIALLPYFTITDSRAKTFQLWREQMKKKLKKATTLLNGPRYLHSTGQLHKGGPNSGLYILMTGDEEKKLPIPDEKFGFETLHQAQALGDFRSLDEKGRRVIRIHLGKDIDAGLDSVCETYTAALKNMRKDEH